MMTAVQCSGRAMAGIVFLIVFFLFCQCVFFTE